MSQTNNLTQIESNALALRAIYAILQQKVTIGTPVFIRTVGVTYKEGIVNSINLDKGYISIEQLVDQFDFIQINEIFYIQVLCTGNEKTTKCKRVQAFCRDPAYNIWLNINIGDGVLVEFPGEPFVAFIQDINLRDRYVGAKSPSGTTYFPIDSLTTVRLLQSNENSIKIQKH